MWIPFLLWYEENRIIVHSLDLADTDTIGTASRLLRDYLLTQNVNRPSPLIYSMIKDTMTKVLPFNTQMSQLSGRIQLLVLDIDNTFSHSYIPIIDGKMLDIITDHYNENCKRLHNNSSANGMFRHVHNARNKYTFPDYMVKFNYGDINVDMISKSNKNMNAEHKDKMTTYWTNIITALKSGTEANLYVLYYLGKLYQIIVKKGLVMSNANNEELDSYNSSLNTLYELNSQYDLTWLIKAVTVSNTTPDEYIKMAKHLASYTTEEIISSIMKFGNFYHAISMIMLTTMAGKMQAAYGLSILHAGHLN